MGSHINNKVQQKEFTADKSNLSKSPLFCCLQTITLKCTFYFYVCWYRVVPQEGVH